MHKIHCTTIASSEAAFLPSPLLSLVVSFSSPLLFPSFLPLSAHIRSYLGLLDIRTRIPVISAIPQKFARILSYRSRHLAQFMYMPSAGCCLPCCITGTEWCDVLPRSRLETSIFAFEFPPLYIILTYRHTSYVKRPVYRRASQYLFLE